MFLLINNLIEKKMTRRASFNFTDSYIIRLTFSDLKYNLSKIKETILLQEAEGSFICKYKLVSLGAGRLDLQNLNYIRWGMFLANYPFLLSLHCVKNPLNIWDVWYIGRVAQVSLIDWLPSGESPLVLIEDSSVLLRDAKSSKLRQGASDIFANLMQYYVDYRCI